MGNKREMYDVDIVGADHNFEKIPDSAFERYGLDEVAIVFSSR